MCVLGLSVRLFTGDPLHDADKEEVLDCLRRTCVAFSFGLYNVVHPETQFLPLLGNGSLDLAVGPARVRRLRRPRDAQDVPEILIGFSR